MNTLDDLFPFDVKAGYDAFCRHRKICLTPALSALGETIARFLFSTDVATDSDRLSRQTGTDQYRDSPGHPDDNAVEIRHRIYGPTQHLHLG